MESNAGTTHRKHAWDSSGRARSSVSRPDGASGRRLDALARPSGARTRPGGSCADAFRVVTPRAASERTCPDAARARAASRPDPGTARLGRWPRAPAHARLRGACDRLLAPATPPSCFRLRRRSSRARQRSSMPALSPSQNAPGASLGALHYRRRDFHGGIIPSTRPGPTMVLHSSTRAQCSARSLRP